MAKKTKEEKEAEKEAKKREKAEKALEKAQKKYEKALAKAAKKKDPEKRAKAEQKAQKKFEKSVTKTVKKYPTQCQQIFEERQAAQQPQMHEAVQPLSTGAKVQQQTQQQVFDGTSSAYERQGATDVYGNPINQGSSRGNSNASGEQESTQEQQPKTMEELVVKLVTELMNAIMKDYFGPEWGYAGEKASFKEDALNSRIEERQQQQELSNQNNLSQQNLQVQDNTQQATNSEPMTEKEQRSFNNWMKQMNISEENQAQLKEKYGEKGAYNIVQKCMAEPKNVMDTAGEQMKPSSKNSIEYFAKLDVSQPENKAKADAVIAMDPPKLNMALVQNRQGGR